MNGKESLQEIDVWFGIGDGQKEGPLKGFLLEFRGKDERSLIKITDPDHLDWCGMEEFEAYQLNDKGYVGYDDYAWSYIADRNKKPHVDKFVLRYGINTFGPDVLGKILEMAERVLSNKNISFSEIKIIKFN